MKKWMMSIAAFVLLSAMTACGVSGNAGAESGEMKSSAIVSTETAHALSEAQEHVRAGYGYGSGNADEGIRMVTDRPFSISIGYVTALSGEDIAETAARADAMMMEEKRKYYQMSGIDRRRSGR